MDTLGIPCDALDAIPSRRVANVDDTRHKTVDTITSALIQYTQQLITVLQNDVGV